MRSHPPKGETNETTHAETSAEDQERRIRGLVQKGFSEHSARIEVLAKDHPPGCECEVCL